MRLGGSAAYVIRLPSFRDPDVPPDELEPELLLYAARRVRRPDDLWCVTTRSPVNLRRAVWQLASYFRREFRYDVVQYGLEGRETDTSARAYLWDLVDPGDAAHHAIGAGCFRWRRYSDAPPGWALQWVWLHPFERNRGHLTRAWPYFRARFEDFDVEPPVSAAMARFLDRLPGEQRPPSWRQQRPGAVAQESDHPTSPASRRRPDVRGQAARGAT
jgi:hypothetical protein